MSADTLPVIELRRAALAGVAGAAVRGELDLATAPLVEEGLDAAIRDSAGPFALLVPRFVRALRHILIQRISIVFAALCFHEETTCASD